MDNPYPICENCIFADEPLDKDPCQECNRAFLAQRIKPNFVSKRKPQTNGDCIRQMTDEELAEHILVIKATKDYCNGDCNCLIQKDKTCYKCRLEWLRKESEGENGRT